MLTIGLTGGIGSGKSTACQLFQDLGVAIIDADSIARQITAKDQPALSSIKAAFGDDILTSAGELDRKQLRQRIFSDQHARQKLEAILHPLIKLEIQQKKEDLSRQLNPYIIIAVPLLLEYQWIDLVDRVLVIDTSIEHQILRSCQRDNSSEAEIRSIIQQQIDRQSRCEAADDIIHNDSDLTDLKAQIEDLHQQYLSMSNP